MGLQDDRRVPIDLLAADITAGPVVLLMALGVVVAIVGHLAGSRLIVGLGIGILFLATVAMMVGGFIAFQGDEVDPRDSKPPSEPSF
jgi:hypothetical protein